MNAEMNDAAIVSGLRNGNHAVMGHVVRRYYNTMLFMVNGIVENNEDAEDIVMKTFEDAYEKIGKYTPTHKFSTWLFTIAHNNSIDVVRKRQRSIKATTPLNDIVLVDNITPEAKLMYNEREEMIGEILSQISDEDKVILDMRNDGMSFDELSEILGKSSVSLRSRFHRMKKNIINQINKI